ncbi:MAG: hypothetical protein QOH93_1229 [Chloroflexia bacterium]|jgi:hypothetical protein|nr:hypothetical protein [Chloroflexia bacterium]
MNPRVAPRFDHELTDEDRGPLLCPGSRSVVLEDLQDGLVKGKTGGVLSAACPECGSVELMVKYVTYAMHLCGVREKGKKGEKGRSSYHVEVFDAIIPNHVQAGVLLQVPSDHWQWSPGGEWAVVRTGGIRFGEVDPLRVLRQVGRRQDEQNEKAAS